MQKRYRRPAVRLPFSLWFVLCCSVPTTQSVRAQDPTPSETTTDVQDPEGQDVPAPANVKVDEETLETLLDSIAEKRQELTEAESALGTAQEGPDRDAAAERVQEIRRQIAKMEGRFAALATGVDISQFTESESQFELSKEVEGLLQPVIQALKDATKGPRRIQQLEQEIERAKSNREAALRVITGVNARDEETDDPNIERELAKIRTAWIELRDDANSTIQVAESEKAALLAQRKSFFDTASEWLDDGFRKRGVDIILAVLAAVAVYLALGVIRRSFRFVRALRERRDRSFYARLFDVLWTIFTYVGMFVAVLVVFYLADDWLMILLVLVVAVGAAWASAQVLPRMVEQIQLVLNLGAARESERILWNGIPYSIHRLGFYTTLLNPALSGGRVRIPIRELIGAHSRPVADGERWFPSNEGDWVILADGTRGRVAMQTPEMVRLMQPGKVPKLYTTADYYAQSPQVISEGYRITTFFGVDYAHQAICTTEIPRIMQERLERDLPKALDPEHIRRIDVEFSSAAASSLDYEIQVDCTGESADRYKVIEQAVPRILVEACNEHGWSIPFTQITLHNAAS